MAENSPKANLNTLAGVENDTPKKVCIYCKVEKDLCDYPKHSLYKDGYDTRCHTCVKKQSKLRTKLHRTAPARPETCECCGEKPLKFCLDHCHETHEFRGWLCDRCNTGIGKLGDTLVGVMKAIKYLRKTQKQKPKK